MARSTCRRRKRNKASQATKLFWKQRREPEAFEACNTHSVDLEQPSCSSTLHEVPTQTVSNEPESEVEHLTRRIPSWGERKFEATPKMHHQSGVLSSVEYESIINHQLSYEPETPKPPAITGSRIVELGYVIQKCLTLQYRHLQKCTCGQLILKEEIPLKGLISALLLECTQCNKIFKMTTENPTKSTSTINAGAVWGTIATGSSFGHLKEFLSCIDVPSMNDYTFYELENQMGKEWLRSLNKSMEEAGRKEKEHAIERKQIAADGTPWITVYVDGSWSKRSYGTNYNAMSGMVGIVGKFTGHLLYIAVRNRYCSICARAENASKECAQHTCYKNWTGSASGMESDMVVAGFSESIAVHGVKYLEFIADGDSSVFARVQEQVPYGHEIHKVECTNHALKNYGKNLRKIKADRHISSSGRKLITNRNIELLTKRAKCSIYEHSQDKNIGLLQEDLRNGIHHVFGDHTKCRANICNTVGAKINDRVPELKSSLVYNHIMGVINLLIRKASLLIQNENNNKSEQLMNIVARFNMGKRLNLIQRGSYERRVHLSGLRYNKSLSWHSSPWKKFTGTSPGKYFKNFIGKPINRLKKCKKTLFPKEKAKGKVNVDYGVLADQPEEDRDIVATEVDLLIQRLQVTSEERERISEESVGQFGNPLFEEERRLRLTASLFGRVVKKRPHTSCHNIVKSCLYPQRINSEAVQYGIVKEEVAISLFEKKTNMKVSKTGLWIDLEYGFLGASPDGVAEDGSLIEVKCLYSASSSNFTTINEVVDNTSKSKICLQQIRGVVSLKRTHTYYYQIQGQLNIARKNKCYFVVYINDDIEIFIEEIVRDEDFWKSEMVPALEKFYRHCVAPEIIVNNIKKGKKCMDPPYILEDQAKRKKKNNVDSERNIPATDNEETIILMVVNSDDE